MVEELLLDILSELKEMNKTLDSLKGSGAYSIDDICTRLDEVERRIGYDSLTDVCDKLDEVKGTGLYNSLSDICDKIEMLTTFD